MRCDGTYDLNLETQTRHAWRWGEKERYHRRSQVGGVGLLGVCLLFDGSMDWHGFLAANACLAWVISLLFICCLPGLALPWSAPPVGCRLEAGAKENISIYLPFACWACVLARISFHNPDHHDQAASHSQPKPSTHERSISYQPGGSGTVLLPRTVVVSFAFGVGLG